MRRFLKIFALVLIVLSVVLGAYIGNLLTSNTYPRPAGQGWARLRDLPHPRGEVGATIVLPGPAGSAAICPTIPCAPQFYVVGGLQGLQAKTVRTVDILDTANGRWRSGPDLPEGRHHPAAAAIDGALYVSGGSRKAMNWAPEKDLWVLRPGADDWAPLPDMPEGRMGHAMVASEGKLYVIGGRGPSSKVLIYDVEEGWSEGATMPGERDHLGAVLVERKIYAIGGRHSGLSKRVDVYDIDTDTWSEGPALPTATSGAVVERLGDGRIHVVGGEDPGTIGGRVLDRHQVLDLATGTWTSGPRALLAVHGSASDEVAGILIITGGSRRQGAYSVLAWTGVTQRFDPREEGASPTATPSPSPSPSPSPTPTDTASPTALPS